METDVNRERGKQESEGEKWRIRADLEAVAINNWVSLSDMETLGKEQFKKKISNSLMVTLILQVELLHSKSYLSK